MKIKLLPLLFLASAPLQTTFGAFVLLSDFDTLAPGVLAGQDGWVRPASGGNPFGASGNNNISTVIADPTESGNQVAAITATTTNSPIHLPLGANAIGASDTSTIFMRFYSTGTTPNFNIGLTDVATPMTANANNYYYVINQAQFGIGTGGGNNLSLNNGSAVNIGTFSANTWYNLWIVVDNGANEQSYYLSTGTNNGTQIGSTTNFRTNGTNGSIQTLQMIAGTTTAVYFDDIYISSGTNTAFIPEPSAFALVSLAGVGLLRRRR